MPPPPPPPAPGAASPAAAAFSPSVHGSARRSAQRRGSDAFSDGGSEGGVAGSAAGGSGSFYSDSVAPLGHGRAAAEASEGAEFSSFSGLSTALGALFNSPTLSDVVLEVAQDPQASSEASLRIPAHRAVLAGWSDVWMRLMTHLPVEMQEGGRVGHTREPVVRINGYPPETVLQLVEFCYKAKTRVTLSTAISLLAAARQFQIEELRRFCEDYCLHSMQATGVCSLHEAANTYNCRRLAEATLQFIVENGDESLGSRDSVNLSQESLLSVLQNDDLVCEEATVFECVARWVRAKAGRELGAEQAREVEGGALEVQQARLALERELFAPFTGHIRYPKIDPNTLRDTVVASGLVESDLLMEALLHHAAPRQAIDSPMVNARFRQRKAPMIGRLQWSVQHSSRRISVQDLDAVGKPNTHELFRLKEEV